MAKKMSITELAEFADAKREAGIPSEKSFEARCKRLEKDCQGAERIWEAAKEEAKRAKEAFDLSVEVLREAIRADSRLPLFETDANGTPTFAPTGPAPGDVLLADLLAAAGVSDAATAALHAAGLDTLFDLEVWLTGLRKDEGSGVNRKNQLADIGGLKPALAKKVAAALAQYQKDRSEEVSGE